MEMFNKTEIDATRQSSGSNWWYIATAWNGAIVVTLEYRDKRKRYSGTIAALEDFEDIETKNGETIFAPEWIVGGLRKWATDKGYLEVQP